MDGSPCVTVSNEKLKIHLKKGQAPAFQTQRLFPENNWMLKTFHVDWLVLGSLESLKLVWNPQHFETPNLKTVPTMTGTKMQTKNRLRGDNTTLVDLYDHCFRKQLEVAKTLDHFCIRHLWKKMRRGAALNQTWKVFETENYSIPSFFRLSLCSISLSSLSPNWNEWQTKFIHLKMEFAFPWKIYIYSRVWRKYKCVSKQS